MRFPKTQIITFANQKGGCGKTTSTVSVATAFAKLGYAAAIVDCDPQCNTSENLGLSVDKREQERLFSLSDAFINKRPADKIAHIFEGRYPGKLAVVPGSRGLGAVEKRLEAQLQARIAEPDSSLLEADEIREEHRLRLKSSLDSLKGVYDVVIIDTGPSLDFLMTSALIAADWFIIPVFPSGHDLAGLQHLMRTVSKVREKYNPSLHLAGVLLGNFDKSTALDREIYELLKSKFGPNVVFETVITRTVKHREATVNHHTIFDHENSEDAANQYIALVKEMIRRGSGASLRPLPNEEVLRKVANG
jgi:chromosome partitioning protein